MYQFFAFSSNAFDWTLIGYPVCISDAKYHRNALIFNVVFLFDRVENYAQSSLLSYEAIVKKVAQVFRTLEVKKITDIFVLQSESKTQTNKSNSMNQSSYFV